MELKDMCCLDYGEVVAQVYIEHKPRNKLIQSYVLCTSCASKRHELKAGESRE